MTPGARVSAAIECLDQIFAGDPAEKTLTRWARRSRFAGSKDRAAVRDHVFDALRKRDSCADLGGALTGRAVMIGLMRLQDANLAELFSGEGHAPALLDDIERELLLKNSKVSHTAHDHVPTLEQWNLQDWCVDLLKSSYPENAFKIANLLTERAPVDLRVNLSKSTSAEAIEQLEEDDIDTERFQISETALRVKSNPRKVKNSKAYLGGAVELQDAGSQALIDDLPLDDCETIFDYCAGGGGKSLAMAARTQAQIFAHDVNSKRMQDIPTRATRAGVQIHCIDKDAIRMKAPFDLVLCDAPCSGSGAWRRSPDAKWKTTRLDFEELLALQARILSDASVFVRAGGVLCYATCSLFTQENEEQVNAFLKSNDDFALISQKSWTPLDGCDGFYVAVLQFKG
jgi:16S rRNA (cytosine967-C5)-methyltransferase